jgi:ArsR family transcriptional regulator
MGILIACGLVDSRKEGRWVYYRVGREQTDFGALIDWIETHINNDPHIALDAKTLEKITSCSPEDFCRKKRIKNCTPKQ